MRLFEFGDVPIGFFPYRLDDVNNIFQYQVPSGLWLPKHRVRDGPTVACSEGNAHGDPCDGVADRRIRILSV